MNIKTRSRLSLVAAVVLFGFAAMDLFEGDLFDAADTALFAVLALAARYLDICNDKLQQENKRLTKALNDAHRTFN